MIHIAITRKVRPGKEAEFEELTGQFMQHSLGEAGMAGVHFLKPPPGSGNREYGILRSFDNEAAQESFSNSALLAEWVQRVEPLVIGQPELRTLQGLEAFFRGDTPPPRWKMALVTWLGVFPCVFIWAKLLSPRLAFLHPILITAVVVAVVVVTLTWGVMPLLTRLFAGWLKRV